MVWYEQMGPHTYEQRVGNGAERFLLGSDPPEVGDQVLFDPDAAVTMYDTYPEDAAPKEYPPWAGFPSA